jgi:hypothetical protein
VKTAYLTAAALLLVPALVAQDPARFAAPVRLEAGAKKLGAKSLGEGRLYPSPVLHDVNGDGLLDVVVGDLRGRITFALREKGTGAPHFAAEQKWMGADGKELDFHNW